MRQTQSKQLQLGEIDIASIQLDTRSRDDVPQILLGLQHLYTNKKIRDLVFFSARRINSSKCQQYQWKTRHAPVENSGAGCIKIKT